MSERVAIARVLLAHVCATGSLVICADTTSIEHQHTVIALRGALTERHSGTNRDVRAVFRQSLPAEAARIDGWQPARALGVPLDGAAESARAS